MLLSEAYSDLRLEKSSVKNTLTTMVSFIYVKLDNFIQGGFFYWSALKMTDVSDYM